MMNRNRYWILILFLVFLSMTVEGVVQKQAFTTPRGLNVKFLIDNTMDFVHAELLIYYQGKFENPAVPSLTLLNIFDKNVNRSGSAVLNILKKLGNDFKVEQTAEYLIFKINFLPGKLLQFTRFLKGLYSYKPFSDTRLSPDSYIIRKGQSDALKKLTDSVKNYWRYFFKREDYKRDVAYQIAHNKLFPRDSIGNTFITTNDIKRATLSHIRAFYRRTFRLPNSLLIMKGNFRSSLMRVYINNEFTTFAKQVPEVPIVNKLDVNNEREIIIFNIDNNEPPVLYLVEAIPPVNHNNYMPLLVINNILFGFPFGRIYKGAREIGISYLEINTEITNHKDISVISNTVRLRFRDIEKFIHLTDRQKEMLEIKKIERKEYLNTLTYIYGKLKVDTQYVDNDVNREILYSFYSPKKNDIISSPSQKPQFTLAVLNKYVDSENTKKGIIIIVGNAISILRHLKVFNPIVINQ